MNRPRAAAPLALLCLLACRPGSAPEPRPATGAGAPEAVVARVEGEAVTRRELEERAKGRLSRLRQEEYEALRATLEEIVSERLLSREAKARGLTPEQLLAQEREKAGAVTPEEVEAVYRQHAARMGNPPLATVAPEIEQAVRRHRQEQQEQILRGELRRKASVTVSLEAPRVEVPVPANALGYGPADAPVTIVEFADYQCPYCRRAQEVVDELLRRYPGKLRIVHQDFPLEGHPRALHASRAVRCAAEQGKFWDYHRSLLTVAGDLESADLEGRARTLGLDLGRFSTCVASDRFDAAIREASANGARLGVSGTPAFFVNGRMLDGARPLEQFLEVVEAELASRP